MERSASLSRMAGNGAAGIISNQLSELSLQVMSLKNQIADLVPDRADEPAPSGVVEDWIMFIFAGQIPANGNLTITQLNDSTGAFDLVFITGIEDGNYQLRVRENFQGKYLQQQGNFVNFANMVGTAQRPYYIRGRRRFRPNTTIVLELTDLSGLANDVQIVFHGVKVSV